MRNILNQETTDTSGIAEAINNLAGAIRENGLGGGGEATDETAAAADGAEGGVGGVDFTDTDALAAWLTAAKDKAIELLPQVIAAAAIVFIGWIVARIITRIVRRALGASNLDKTLVNFVASLIYMALMVFVVISALGKLGVDTTSFAAIIGAATFAIGFALQGSLANFAAGVMLMIFRPIRVGDLVEAGGILGTVEEVGVFATIINTLENKKAIIANSTITADNIINYTANGSLRVDMTFGIGYEDDMNKAMKIMTRVLSEDERVLDEPAATVACNEHGDSSVNFVCRPFVHPDDYWDVWFDTHKRVKEEFDSAGISIPFPQRDIHVVSGSTPAA